MLINTKFELQKKNQLRRKLKTKSDIERVILEVEEDLDTMKKGFKKEIKAKEQLEWMMEVEIHELNRRLNNSHFKSIVAIHLLTFGKLQNRLTLEAAAREKLTTYILAEIDTLKTKFNQSIQQHVDSHSAASNGSDDVSLKASSSFIPAPDADIKLDTT